MPSTERLYYNDSHLIEFNARVVDITERVSGWLALYWTAQPFIQPEEDNLATRVRSTAHEWSNV
jgi:hypothetical protein